MGVPALVPFWLALSVALMRTREMPGGRYGPTLDPLRLGL